MILAEGTSARKAELYGSFIDRRPRWYVAAIMVGYEATALVHLARQGFESFIPYGRPAEPARKYEIEPEYVRAGKKLVATGLPRFRGYAFVSLDLDCDQWRSVNGTRGVRHLLPLACERPIPLPMGFVERLRTEPGKADEILIEYAADQLVKIIAGPFAGNKATVRSQDKPGGRIRGELAESGWPVSLPIEEIEPA